SGTLEPQAEQFCSPCFQWPVPTADAGLVHRSRNRQKHRLPGPAKQGDCMNDLSKLEVRGIPDPWKEGIAAGWPVIDASQLNEDRTIEADVVIIGSGAGGGVSAEILSQSGLRVVIIEAARLKTTDQFNMDEGEAYRDLYQEGAARAAKDGSIAILQGRAVG